MSSYKIILVGDSGVGKTTLIHRHLTGEFTTEHKPTLGVEVDPISFDSNHGKIMFNVWDTAGDERYNGLGDGYYVGAQGAIIMVDTQSASSFQRIPFWVDAVRNMVDDIPIVVCGNKVDLRGSKTPSDIGNRYIYYDISAKSCYHFDKPFLYLARQFLGEDTAWVQVQA